MRTHLLQKLRPQLESTFRSACRGARRHQGYATATSHRAPHVAIIGAGPAGFYAAHRLQQKLSDVKIDMYERLPTPFGLVRFGVAPDHPEVKNCIDTFTAVAESANFKYVGNVKLGEAQNELPLSSLVPHYDALLFSYGASQDRRLGVPGEDLNGVYSARAFVAWYNGLPEFAGLAPDLSSETAVVIGQGNVAMDVTRVLLSPLERLRQTDIAEGAIEALSKSRVKKVHVVGRRGPLQAAYTTKELRELMNLEGVAFSTTGTGLLPHDLKSLPRTSRRAAEVLVKGSKTKQAQKSWSLDFLLNPCEFHAAPDSNAVGSVSLTPMELRPDQDLDMTDPNAIRGQRSTVCFDAGPQQIECGLVFKSVGYKSETIAGLEKLGVLFDEKMGIIPNDVHGRVLNPRRGPGTLTAGIVPGLYTAGWVKRGPTGVIATTMDDAFNSADVVQQDWEAQVPFLGSRNEPRHGWEGVREEAIRRGIRRIDWQDWTKIDTEEKRRGKAKGKEREKCGSVKEMLQILDS